jgi:hypothetical protein
VVNVREKDDMCRDMSHTYMLFNVITIFYRRGSTFDVEDARVQAFVRSQKKRRVSEGAADGSVRQSSSAIVRMISRRRVAGAERCRFPSESR